MDAAHLPELQRVLDIAQAIGWPTALVAAGYVIWLLRSINARTLIMSLEHETLMEWWQDNHPGLRRPAEALAQAKRVGL